MAVSPISRKLAEQALEAIKAQFIGHIDVYGDNLKLIESWTESGHWAICWEEGPYEWACRAVHGGIDEEVSGLTGNRVDTPAAEGFPAEVFAEPVNAYVLGLYPNS